jgi:hypothetical protein
MRGDFAAPRQNKHQSKERTVAMTDAEFINESLLLENKIIGLKVNMERLRKFFEYALRELCNKNYAEAEKLFQKYWHQHKQDFRVFHNLSENEIYNIIKRRGTVANAASKLLEMGWKLTYLVDHIRIWRAKGKIVFDALELCQSVQNEQRRTAAEDVRSRIAEMKLAKDDMVRVFNLVRQLSVFIGVPFITEYISVYANIFVELGNLCDKVADYAMRIVEETENALGSKSGWSQVFNNPNSAFNKNKVWAAEDKMKSR